MRIVVWACPAYGCGNVVTFPSASSRARMRSPLARVATPRPCVECAMHDRPHVDLVRLEFEDGLDHLRQRDAERRATA